MPDFSQNFNRYSYCFNNPFKFTDPSGEWLLVDDLVAMAIGGTVNLVVNIVQGNIHGNVWECIGQGAAAFGAGAAAGELALYGPAGWVAGGAIVGATNTWLAGGSTQDIVTNGVIGGVAGLAGGYAGQLGGKLLGGVIINGARVTSPVLQGAITGTIGGATGGYVGGFTAGYIMTGDLAQANKAGLNGAAFGAPIGGISGSISAYRHAVKNEISPWTGKPINTQSQTTTVYRVASSQEYADIQNNGIRVNPDGAGYQDGKLFYTSYEDALKGQVLLQKYNGESFIIEVAYPTNIINNSYHFTPDGMNAIMINSLNLNKSILIRYK
ncbi:RHS repeat-associated core domain-containing protein [Viscerimonas tarda]